MFLRVRSTQRRVFVWKGGGGDVPARHPSQVMNRVILIFLIIGEVRLGHLFILARLG